MRICLLPPPGAQQVFPDTGIGWSSQPNLHREQPCASILCSPPAVIPHSTTSFHLFFGLPFLHHSSCNAVLFCPLYMFESSQSLFRQEIINTLYSCHIKNLIFAYFSLQGFSTKHMQHSHSDFDFRHPCSS